MTKTGGRGATVRHILGDGALSVGMPNTAPPSGWRWVALTDVARLESGHTPSRRNAEYWGGDVPWISIRDAKAYHGGTIYETNETTNDLGIENSSARILPKGTVCLSRTASVGYVTIMGRPMSTSQDFVNWVCSETLEPHFLQYLLICEKPSLARFSSGAVHQTIYFPEVKAFHICLPAVEEQRRIVAVLDEAFSAIATATAHAEKNLANSRELFSGELRQFFAAAGSSWPWKPLGDVADARLGKMLDKQKNTGKLFPYLRNLNVRWFGFDLANMLEMPFEADEKSRYSAIKGDLMIVEGGYPGRCAIWESDEPIYFQKAVHRVRFDDTRLAKILMYLLFARDGDGTLKQYFSGSGIQHLTGQSLAKITVPLPPAAERDAIVSRIEAMFSLSEDAHRFYRRKIVRLSALKQSILNRAFTGDLAGRKILIANDNFATPKGSAQIIAFAYWLHKKANRDKSYKHVKAQKCLHNVENIAAIELGRQPRKFPYGPHDPDHMDRMERWAKENGFFEFVPSMSGLGLDFKKLANYDALWTEAIAVIRPFAAALERAIEPLVPMNMEEAELFATVHAAWNNLLHDGAAISDDAIVTEARENWDPAKANIPRHRFVDTIKLIIKRRMQPDGTGKYVRGQARLL